MIGTVFLDRDGVINDKAAEDDYIASWDRFRFAPGALEALRRLAQAEVRIVVLTNQRGIARGRLTEEDLAGIHQRMAAAVEAADGRIDAIFHCPHDLGVCDCRKPGTGLFTRAAAQLPAVRFAESATVGDSLSDVEPAVRVGSLAYLVGDGPRLTALLEEAEQRGLPVAGSGRSLLDVVTRHLLEDGSDYG
ncbi:MAG: HAD-IIIA family hydrolase [Chloroflexi bacterium]|nr:HAD-IIIA family hydrolase [Chloroflexota bacterium]